MRKEETENKERGSECVCVWGGAKDNVYEKSEQQGGERENPAKTNSTFGETCFSCWIQGLSSFQHSLVVIAHFFVFTVASVGPDRGH